MPMLFITFTSNHHLMKNLILFFLLLFSFNSFSQTIPWATQQPKWVFPIYAKDANGNRDTVYLGYDPSASQYNPNEFIFGEYYEPNPMIFNLFLYSNSTYGDSIIKADVKDTLDGALRFELNGNYTVFPLTLYWDVSLLRSDSLPFPIQAVYPKAWFALYYAVASIYVSNVPPFSCTLSTPAIFTDTANYFDCQCHVQDSIVLADIFGDTTPVAFVMSINVDPWHNCFLSVDEIEKENEIVIYPNPSSGIINLKNLFYEEIIIRNSFGCVIFHSNDFARRPQLDVSFLPNGLYFIELISPKNQSQIINKLIISK